MSEVWKPLQDVMDAALKYPAWICADCGEQYGNRPVGIATWHEDTCGICGRVTACTEPRDYGHLRNGWQDGKDTNETE
jgi:hypothetical protein